METSKPKVNQIGSLTTKKKIIKLLVNSTFTVKS